MCNCGTFGAVITPNKKILNLECLYNIEQIIAWKDLLLCLKNNTEIDNRKYNKSLGVVLSCIRMGNPCYLEKEIINIEPFINQLISLNLCN